MPTGLKENPGVFKRALSEASKNGEQIELAASILAMFPEDHRKQILEELDIQGQTGEYNLLELASEIPDGLESFMELMEDESIRKAFIELMALERYIYSKTPKIESKQGDRFAIHNLSKETYRPFFIEGFSDNLYEKSSEKNRKLFYENVLFPVEKHEILFLLFTHSEAQSINPKLYELSRQYNEFRELVDSDSNGEGAVQLYNSTTDTTLRLIMRWYVDKVAKKSEISKKLIIGLEEVGDVNKNELVSDIRSEVEHYLGQASIALDLKAVHLCLKAIEMLNQSNIQAVVIMCNNHNSESLLVKLIIPLLKGVTNRCPQELVHKDLFESAYRISGEEVTVYSEQLVELVDNFLYVEENYNGVTNKDILLGVMEAKDRSRLYALAKKGSIVVSMIVPGGNELGIKSLNENYVGYHVTDKVLIPKRYELLRKYFGVFCEEASIDYGENTFVINAEKLEEIKQDLIQEGKILDSASDAEVSGAIAQKLEEFNLKFAQEYSEFLIEKLQDAIIHEGDASKRNDIGKLINKLNEDPPKLSYAMAIGTAVVDQEVQGGDFSSIQSAYANSLMAARISREQALTNPENSEGAYSQTDVVEFSPDTLSRQLDNIGNLRNQINNELSNSHGLITYTLEGVEINEPVFIADSESGESFLNQRVVYGIRKDEIDNLTINEGQQNILSLIKNYILSVNFLDRFVYYSSAEVRGKDNLLSGVSLSDKVTGFNSVYEKLKNGIKITKEDLPVLLNALNNDAQDDTLSSRSVFHEKAFETGNKAVYVQLDLVGLGAKVVCNWEKAALRLVKSQGEENQSLENLTIEVGDELLDGIRIFRKKVIDFLKSRGIDNPAVQVGGDELVIALEESDKFDLEKLLVQLSREVRGEARVMTTRVVANKREGVGSEQNRIALLNEHVKALMGLDPGAEESKMIEKALRRFRIKLMNEIQYQTDTDLTELQLEVVYSGLMRAFGYLDFVILGNSSDGDNWQIAMNSELQSRVDTLDTILAEVNTNHSDIDISLEQLTRIANAIDELIGSSSSIDGLETDIRLDTTEDLIQRLRSSLMQIVGAVAKTFKNSQSTVPTPL